MDNKYQNGKIYKIVDIGYNKWYIGSTCESLSQRMARHRNNYKQYLLGRNDRLTSFFMFDEVGIDNCKIELIEHYPCNSKEELVAREGHHIKTIDCVNKHIPTRSPQEWYNDNRGKLLQQFKDHHENDKDKVHQRKAEKVLCECGVQISKSHKSQHLKTKGHCDRLQIESTQTKPEPISCLCGSSFQPHEKGRHEKTKKHQEWLKQQEQQQVD